MASNIHIYMDHAPVPPAPKAEERGQGKGQGGDPQGDGGAERCVCPECGTTAEHIKGSPCTEQTCPKCGAAMRGENAASGEATSFTTKPWDGSLSRYTIDQALQAVPRAIAQWARQQAKAADRDVIKSDLKLPIREPDGTVNVNALRNALARINQVKGVPASVLAKAKAEIQRLLDQYRRRQGGESVTANYRAMHSLLAERALVPVRIEARCEALDAATCEQFSMPTPYEPAMTGRRAKVVIAVAGRSLNNNIYSEKVLEAAAPKFNGAKVFYDHKDSGQRSFRDLAGEIKVIGMGDARTPDGDIKRGLLGVLEVLEADTWLQKVIAEKPHLVGLSMYVWAYSKRNDDGSETIESIEKVQSVDLVDDPAAGGGVISVLEQAPVQPPPDQAQAPRPGGETIDADPVTDGQKEEEDMEKIKELEAKVKELEQARAEGEKRAGAAEEELAKLRRERLIEEYLRERRDEIKPSVEAAVREAAAALDEVDRDKLAALEAEWTARAEAFAKDFAPATEAEDKAKKVEDKKEDAPAQPAGLPPKRPTDAEDGDEALAQKAAETVRRMIEGFVGVVPDDDKPAN